MEYKFNENTKPKEIVTSAMLEIAELMKDDGFKFLKSKSEIIKKTKDFIFKVWFKSNKWNQRGNSTEVWIHCYVSDNKDETEFWSKTLAISNSKQDQFHSWELYDNENYLQSLNSIKNIISFKLLPFFKSFEYDLKNLTNVVAQNGFCVFDGKQVYDAGYKIPLNFLAKYGTKEQLTIAFQNYVDRHELIYVKINFKESIELLKSGKELKSNGERYYAEFAIKNQLVLKF